MLHLVDIGVVAVDMPLLETADIEIALQRPGFRCRNFAVERDKLHVVPRRLRPGVDRLAVLIEQLDRRRPDHTEIVPGDGADRVDFGAVAAPADVAVEASDLRRRLVAPAGVLDALRRKIDADTVLFCRRIAALRSGAAVRAALCFDLDAADR